MIAFAHAGPGCAPSNRDHLEPKRRQLLTANSRLGHLPNLTGQLRPSWRGLDAEDQGVRLQRAGQPHGRSRLREAHCRCPLGCCTAQLWQHDGRQFTFSHHGGRACSASLDIRDWSILRNVQRQQPAEFLLCQRCARHSYSVASYGELLDCRRWMQAAVRASRPVLATAQLWQQDACP